MKYVTPEYKMRLDNLAELLMADRLAKAELVQAAVTQQVVEAPNLSLTV